MSDNAKQNQFRLIKGTFVAADARQILMTLVDDKISFHQRNNWSQKERFGEADAIGLKRIEQLQQTKQAIEKLIDDAAGGEQHLQIECDIKIERVSDA